MALFGCRGLLWTDGVSPGAALLPIPIAVAIGTVVGFYLIDLPFVALAQAMVGSYTGSLGIVAILGCTFFAALSESGPATTAAIGAVMVPAMIRQK